MLPMDGKLLSQSCKKQSLTVALQNLEKADVKHFIENPILLNFVRLLAISFPSLSEELFFPLQLDRDLTEFLFLIYFALSEY